MQSLPMRRAGRKAQSGFTLVEIAIVLVIIGLLLGGVLKGQELIENGRVKNAASDMNGIVAAYNSYLDRYRRLPGDDPGAVVARGTSWTGVVAGNGDGVITARASLVGDDESDNFFQHLRAAGFITGNPAAAVVAALPLNAWGGRTNIVNVASIQGRPAVARLLLCTGNVPGKAATALDIQLDDGNPQQGSFRATIGTNNAVPGAAPVAYSEDQTYTVCRDLG